MQNNPRIVVIDPDPDIRMTLEYTLGKAGYLVFAVKNADEGLHRCLSERPIAVLTEVALAGMDGYELCGKIKGEPVTRQITRVMFMTEHPENEVFVKGPEVCADYYIPKPFNPASLIADLGLMVELNFKLSRDHLSMLCLAKRIPTHREAITPGYSTDSKKVVHLNPPSVKFGETDEYGRKRKPGEKRPAQKAVAKPQDPRLVEVNELLKSLVGSFRDTQHKLRSVVTYLDKKTEHSQVHN